MSPRIFGAILLAFWGGWIGGFSFKFEEIPVWIGIPVMLTPGLMVLAAILLVWRPRSWRE